MLFLISQMNRFVFVRYSLQVQNQAYSPRRRTSPVGVEYNSFCLRSHQRDLRGSLSNILDCHFAVYAMSSIKQLKNNSAMRTAWLVFIGCSAFNEISQPFHEHCLRLIEKPPIPHFPAHSLRAPFPQCATSSPSQGDVNRVV